MLRCPCTPWAAILVTTFCCDRELEAVLQEHDAPSNPRVPAMLYFTL